MFPIIWSLYVQLSSYDLEWPDFYHFVYFFGFFTCSLRSENKNLKGDFFQTCVLKSYDCWMWEVMNSDKLILIIKVSFSLAALTFQQVGKLHFQKIKKSFGVLFYACVPNITIIRWLGGYGCRWVNVCNFGLFFFFFLLLQVEKIKSSKNEKKSGDDLILDMCTKY